jgi:hypothetical protein
VQQQRCYQVTFVDLMSLIHIRGQFLTEIPFCQAPILSMSLRSKLYGTHRLPFFDLGMKFQRCKKLVVRD